MGEELINRELSIPLHSQVRLIISNRIKSGEYPLGSRMPNEVDLSRELQISRPTIRRALDELEAAGMVERVRPKGTFVSRIMKKEWFENDDGFAAPYVKTAEVKKLQIAMEEGLTDLFLLRSFDEYTTRSGWNVELVHWNNWYDAIENIVNKFVDKAMPDIFSVSNDAVGILARMGIIQPLDQFIAPQELQRIKARCARYGLNAYVHDGKLYGYPLFSETRLLIYRRDHFQNAGIPDPEERPLTHDTFVEVGKMLSNPDQGLYAFAYSTSHEPQTLQNMMPWLIQRGGRMFRIDNGRVLPATEEPEFIDALHWYTGLALEEKICPPNMFDLSERDITSMLVKGQISMMIAHPAVYTWLLDGSASGQQTYGLASFPAGPVNSFSFMGGMPLCISSICENPQAAWDLIAFVCEPEKLHPYLNRMGTLPPIELYDAEEILKNVPQSLSPVVRALETAVPHTYPVGYNQALDFVRTGYWQGSIPQILDLILRKKLTVENAAQFLSMSIRSFSKLGAL